MLVVQWKELVLYAAFLRRGIMRNILPEVELVPPCGHVILAAPSVHVVPFSVPPELQ